MGANSSLTGQVGAPSTPPTPEDIETGSVAHIRASPAAQASRRHLHEPLFACPLKQISLRKDGRLSRSCLGIRESFFLPRLEVDCFVTHLVSIKFKRKVLK